LQQQNGSAVGLRIAMQRPKCCVSRRLSKRQLYDQSQGTFGEQNSQALKQQTAESPNQACAVAA
jgi:hypothetical protein